MNPDSFIRSPLHAKFVDLLHHEPKDTLDWSKVFEKLNAETEIALSEEEREIFSLLYTVFHHSMRGGKEVFIAKDRKDSNAQHCINTVLEAKALFDQAGDAAPELCKEVYRKILLHDLGEFFREFSNNGAVEGSNLPKVEKDEIETLIANRIIPLAAQAVKGGTETKAAFIQQCREMQTNVRDMQPIGAAEYLKNYFLPRETPAVESETVTALLRHYNQVEGHEKTFADYLAKSIEKVQGQGWYLYHDLTSAPDFEENTAAQKNKRYTRHAYAPSEVQVIIHRNAFRHLYAASKRAETPEQKAIIAAHLDNVYESLLQAVDLGTGRLSFTKPKESLIVDSSTPDFAQKVLENHEAETKEFREGEKFVATQVGLRALLSAMRKLQVIPKGKHSPLEILEDDSVEIYNLKGNRVEVGDILHEAAYHLEESNGLGAFTKKKKDFVKALNASREKTPYAPEAEEEDVNTTTPKKISFCTTVMNRGQHLKETLPQNLANNPGEHVEFVILDYGDKDGIDGQSIKEWLLEHHRSEIESGRIRYARTEQEHFKMAHAKNMAHRLATGDVLCNLDADNVTGEGFAGWLGQEFERDGDLCVRLHQVLKHLRGLNPSQKEGTSGRVALSRESFHRLHGYNEGKHNGYTGDDTDLIYRAQEHGLHLKDIDTDHLGFCLSHNEKERLKNLSDDDQALSHEHIQHMRGGYLIRLTTI